MLDRDLVLSTTEQDRIRKLLGPAETINECLAKTAEVLKKGDGFSEALITALPWLKHASEVGEAVAIVGAALRFLHKWLELKDPFELGALACTLAYQSAAAASLRAVAESGEQYRAAVRIDPLGAQRIANKRRPRRPISAASDAKRRSSMPSSSAQTLRSALESAAKLDEFTRLLNADFFRFQRDRLHSRPR